MVDDDAKESMSSRFRTLAGDRAKRTAADAYLCSTSFARHRRTIGLSASGTSVWSSSSLRIAEIVSALLSRLNAGSSCEHFVE